MAPGPIGLSHPTGAPRTKHGLPDHSRGTHGALGFGTDFPGEGKGHLGVSAPPAHPEAQHASAPSGPPSPGQHPIQEFLEAGLSQQVGRASGPSSQGLTSGSWGNGWGGRHTDTSGGWHYPSLPICPQTCAQGLPSHLPPPTSPSSRSAQQDPSPKRLAMPSSGWRGVGQSWVEEVCTKLSLAPSTPAGLKLPLLLDGKRERGRYPIH